NICRNAAQNPRTTSRRLRHVRVNRLFEECMHFVLSKPLDEYKGSIGEALRHYDYLLAEARKERSVDEVDKKSGREPAVLNWFYQTQFWEQNKSKCELEYDGFVEHFADLPGINEKNYADYYSEEDVYRQKVLEGYGCRFLRINRF